MTRGKRERKDASRGALTGWGWELVKNGNALGMLRGSPSVYCAEIRAKAVQQVNEGHTRSHLVRESHGRASQRCEGRLLI